LLLGLSGYSGRAAIEKSGMAVHDDDFLRIGADLHIVFDNLMLDLVAVQQKHDQPTDIANTPQTLQLALAELTWVVHAFAFPTLRFEASRREHDNIKDSRWLATAMVTTVIRPNVLLRLAGEIGGDEAPDDHTDFRSAVLSFSAAF
jgi:hypothetical protein